MSDHIVLFFCTYSRGSSYTPVKIQRNLAGTAKSACQFFLFVKGEYLLFYIPGAETRTFALELLYCCGMVKETPS